MSARCESVTVAQLGLRRFGRQLKSGLRVKIGPFPTRIEVTVDEVVGPLFELYRDYEVLAGEGIDAFHVCLRACRVFPKPARRVIRFSVDGRAPHEDMPPEQALAVLEWGINLAIALRSHCYLMLHAAVVELDGVAMVLPAEPGSGKTTLCGGLAVSGWRLFSDEFGLIRPGTRDIVPAPRPMALKNESIEVIRSFAPDAYIGPEIEKTKKGTVAHLRPAADALRRSAETAPVKWIVFPRWRPGVPSRLSELPKAEAFMFLATNAFNYELIGEPAFHTVADLVDNARCFRFEYSDLANAVAALTDFVRRNDV